MDIGQKSHIFVENVRPQIWFVERKICGQVLFGWKKLFPKTIQKLKFKNCWWGEGVGHLKVNGFPSFPKITV